MKISTGVAGIMSIALLGAPMAMFATGCSCSSNASHAVAATVNGENIEEQTITDYIQNFRTSNHMDDDQTWAQWLVDNGRDAESVREDAIDYFVQLALIDQAAKEQGIDVTTEEVDAQYEEIKDYYGFSDDEFVSQLEDLGYTVETYKDYLRQSLIQEQLMQIVSSDDEVDPSEILSTANSYTSVLNGAKKITTIVVEDEAAANDLKAQADSGANFATLANENSITNDYNGWDVLMGIDQTVYDALSNAKQGDITSVIKSDDGTHYFIIKIDEVLNVDVENGFASADEIPAEIYAEFESTVKQSLASTEFDTYLQGLKDEADITINPMPAKLPYDVSLEGVEASSASTNLANNVIVDEPDESEDTSIEPTVEVDEQVVVDEEENTNAQ